MAVQKVGQVSEEVEECNRWNETNLERLHLCLCTLPSTVAFLKNRVMWQRRIIMDYLKPWFDVFFWIPNGLVVVEGNFAHLLTEGFSKECVSSRSGFFPCAVVLPCIMVTLKTSKSVKWRQKSLLTRWMDKMERWAHWEWNELYCIDRELHCLLNLQWWKQTLCLCSEHSSLSLQPQFLPSP